MDVFFWMIREWKTEPVSIRVLQEWSSLEDGVHKATCCDGALASSICLSAANTVLLLSAHGVGAGGFVPNPGAGAGLVPPLPPLRFSKAVEAEAGTRAPQWEGGAMPASALPQRASPGLWPRGPTCQRAGFPHTPLPGICRKPRVTWKKH